LPGLKRQNARVENWRRHFVKPDDAILLTQTQFSDQIAVTGSIFALQVGQQRFTTVNHHNQTTTRVVIFGVL
jgi:hypothetical protein